MKRQIWRVKDVNECYDPVTGEASPFITYHDAKWNNTFDEVLRKDAGDATLEELVELCDQNAENRNAHDYCGCHRLLGALLYKRHGRKGATKTMREIAEYGGLHGMAGICNHSDEEDAYAEMGVGVAGHDWNGSFGA